jgi:hypothetical protein
MWDCPHVLSTETVRGAWIERQEDGGGSCRGHVKGVNNELFDY